MVSFFTFDNQAKQYSKDKKNNFDKALVFILNETTTY